MKTQHTPECVECGKVTLQGWNICSECQRKPQNTPTPFPWYVKGTNPPRIYANDGMEIIAQVDSSEEMSVPQELANAAFIVRAVNAHEDLVESMKAIQERLYKGFSYGPKMKDSADVCFNDALALATVTLRNLGEAIAKTEGKE